MSDNTRIVIKGFTIGRYPINGYLFYDRISREAAFVDPGGYTPEISEFIEKHRIKLRYLLITHGHWDHIEGYEQFKELFQPESYAGLDEYPAADNLATDNMKIPLGDLEITCLATPGHSENGISYYCEGNIFTGDAIFAGSVGGTKGINNARKQKKSVMEKIFTLEGETRLFPAHGPSSTVATEKEYNPFFYNRLTD